jgi:hypothetical protein
MAANTLEVKIGQIHLSRMEDVKDGSMKVSRSFLAVILDKEYDGYYYVLFDAVMYGSH